MKTRKESKQINELEDEESKESKKYVLVCLADIPLNKPISKVKATKDSFVIDTGHYTYDIDFSRCDSVSKVLKWIAHLSQKRWMSAKMLNTFVQISLGRLDTSLISK